MNVNLDDLGRQIVELVLDLAAFLFTDESAPGVASLVLVVVLVVLSTWHRISAIGLGRAVGAAQRALDSGSGHITNERLASIEAGFQKLKGARNKGPRHRLAVAWDEFRETSIPPGSENERLSNTVRPAAFFSREELGLDRGMWRQVPAMFVSVGLFLTFLGLVAALHQTGQILDAAGTGDGAATDGLKTLLRIAGTKFIMSLTGLLCSIVFTLVLRYDARRIDKALHSLCDDIEKGCIFLSEQTILGKMLEQAKEQTDHLKSFSTELVAQIATPLREDLPNTIRESLLEPMGTLVERIGGLTSGVESATERIGEYAEAIETSRNAIASANEGLDRSAETLITTATPVRDAVFAISSATGTMGDRVETASEAMRQTTAHTEAIMRGAREAIEASQSTMSGATSSLERAVMEFGEVVNRYREIDQSLGGAFEKIETAVRSSINEIGEFERKLNDEFGSALNRLEAVIARVEPFTPRPEE